LAKANCFGFKQGILRAKLVMTTSVWDVSKGRLPPALPRKRNDFQSINVLAKVLRICQYSQDEGRKRV
jgi:hypothetical protein